MVIFLQKWLPFINLLIYSEQKVLSFQWGAEVGNEWHKINRRSTGEGYWRPQPRTLPTVCMGQSLPLGHLSQYLTETGTLRLDRAHMSTVCGLKYLQNLSEHFLQHTKTAWSDCSPMQGLSQAEDSHALLTYLLKPKLARWRCSRLSLCKDKLLLLVVTSH